MEGDRCQPFLIDGQAFYFCCIWSLRSGKSRKQLLRYRDRKQFQPVRGGSIKWSNMTLAPVNVIKINDLLLCDVKTKEIRPEWNLWTQGDAEVDAQGFSANSIRPERLTDCTEPEDMRIILYWVWTVKTFVIISESHPASFMGSMKDLVLRAFEYTVWWKTKTP